MRPVIAFFSLLILASAANAGTLKLCNKGDIPLRLALIYEDRRGGSTAWVASGWTTVAPGCKELLKSSGNMQMYTSLVRAYKHIANRIRSEEHTSELQSLMRISYAVFCLKKKIKYE